MSFKEIYKGFERANHSVQHSGGELIMAFNDGETFRKLYGFRIDGWYLDDEVSIFTTFYTDGFEIWDGRMNSRDTWRFILIIINFGFEP